MARAPDISPILGLLSRRAEINRARAIAEEQRRQRQQRARQAAAGLALGAVAGPSAGVSRLQGAVVGGQALPALGAGDPVGLASAGANAVGFRQQNRAARTNQMLNEAILTRTRAELEPLAAEGVPTTTEGPAPTSEPTLEQQKAQVGLSVMDRLQSGDLGAVSPQTVAAVSQMFRPAQGEGFTLGPNQVRFDARGQVVARGPEPDRASTNPTIYQLVDPKNPSNVLASGFTAAEIKDFQAKYPNARLQKVGTGSSNLFGVPTQRTVRESREDGRYEIFQEWDPQERKWVKVTEAKIPAPGEGRGSTTNDVIVPILDKIRKGEDPTLGEKRALITWANARNPLMAMFTQQGVSMPWLTPGGEGGPPRVSEMDDEEVEENAGFFSEAWNSLFGGGEANAQPEAQTSAPPPAQPAPSTAREQTRPVPRNLREVPGLQYNPATRQYRDPNTGAVYDENGNRVSAQ